MVAGVLSNGVFDAATNFTNAKPVVVEIKVTKAILIIAIVTAYSSVESLIKDNESSFEDFKLLPMLDVKWRDDPKARCDGGDPLGGFFDVLSHAVLHSLFGRS